MGISDMCLGEAYGMSREECYGNLDAIVKTDTGYGDLNTFNNDMLLMTGYLCHKCLPEVCLNGGKCTNLWSKGFTCECPAVFGGTLCERDLSATTTAPAPATTTAPRDQGSTPIIQPDRTQMPETTSSASTSAAATSVSVAVAVGVAALLHAA